MKLIRKTVSIHQSAQQFGFSSSAGYMLIIVLVRLFPIHIWNLQPSRELIKLEEKYKKNRERNQRHFTFNMRVFFSFCSQPHAYNALTDSAPAEQMHKAFPSIKDWSRNEIHRADILGRQCNPPVFINTSAVPPSSTASHQPYPFPLG